MSMPTEPERQPLALLEYAAALWRRKGLIVTIFVLGVAGTVAYTLPQPKIYESTATILVPKEGLGPGGAAASLAASGLLQQIPGISLPSLAPNRDLLISLLKSRTLNERIAEHFKLQELYHTKYLFEAANAVQGATQITVSREGLVLVTVAGTDPTLAAAIANYYFEELERFVMKIGSGEASRQRIFINEQLDLSKKQLVASENLLRRFQEQNKAIILQDQTRGVIEAAARLKGEIVATEVQLQVLRAFATESNPEIISLKRRLDEMKRQLTQVQYGDGLTMESRPGGRRGDRDITVPFAKVPQLSLELARVMRDVKTHETVVTLLTQQLEQAKIAEARDFPAFQVLDPALPPLHAIRPRLRLNVTIAGVASLLAGVFLAFVLENIRSAPVRRPVPSR
jgi:uncharacterized protein involved in exopolysaccharide biosynthesis